jgi:Spherulation-specific family 4
MAERRPLVLVSGELRELPAGDTLPGASGGQNSTYPRDPNLVVIDEDFISGSAETGEYGLYGWSTSGGVVQFGTNEANHPGTLDRITTLANAAVTLFPANSAAASGINIINLRYARFVVRMSFTGGGDVRVGLLNGVSTGGISSGVFFEHLEADTNWFFVTTNGVGGTTRTDTGAPFNADWLKLEFFPVGSGSNRSWRGYINGALCATHGTTLPLEGDSNPHFPGSMLNQITASMTLRHDQIYAEYLVSGRDNTLEPFVPAPTINAAIRTDIPVQPRAPGVIYPLYYAIADAYTDPNLSALVSDLRAHPNVPAIIIANTAASGPGSSVDANVNVATLFLKGVGCRLVGYVDTDYGAKSVSSIRAEIVQWMNLYPQIEGIFFDRVGYGSASGAEPEALRRADYKGVREYAEAFGLRTLVFNAGSGLLSDWYATGDDVFGRGIVVIAEGAAFPSEATQVGFNNTHLFLPSWQRAAILHSQPSLPSTAVAAAKRYYGWLHLGVEAATPGPAFQSHPSYYGALLDLLDGGAVTNIDGGTASSIPIIGGAIDGGGA